MLSNSIFVTGTDTGVGKTLVTALLVLKLRELGVDCVPMKPFASGCLKEGSELISEDAAFLMNVLQLEESQDEICPIRLEEPLAPLIAARRAGISTREWPEIARSAFEKLQARHECVVVEGVGGLLAPIWDNGQIGTNRELLESWGLPTVLVARRTLGTINHTLLTLDYPLDAPSRFCGLVFNDSMSVEEDDVAARTSPDFIEEQTSVPVWGSIPFTADVSPENLQKLSNRLNIRF